MTAFSDPYDDATYIASQVGTQVPAGTLVNIDASEGVTLPLNGSSQYVTFADNPSWESDTAGSIAAWIKIDDYGASNNTIFFLGDSAGSAAYADFQVRNTGLLEFIARTDGAEQVYIRAVQVLAAGQWYHVAVTANGTDTYALYIDGILQTDATVTVGGSTVEGDWFSDVNSVNTTEYGTIGANRNSTISHYLKGTIDDFRLYSTALSADTIFSLAQAGIEPGSETVHLKFNEGTGTAIDDTGSAGTDGTAVGTPTWTTTHKQPFTQRSKTISTAIVDGASAIATVKKTATKKPGGANQRLSVSSNGADWTNSAGENTTNAGGRYFDGVDDKCTVASHADFIFGDGSTDSAFSVSAWVYMLDAVKFKVVGRSDTSNLEWLLHSDVGGNMGLALFDNSSGGFIGNGFDASSMTNRWFHIAATYSGGGAATDISIYLNGQLQPDATSDASYTAMEAKAGVLAIGHGLGSQWAKGKIDDVRVYAEELSASSIYDLFTKHTQPSTSNLRGHWKFDGDLLDSSGNSHTLTNAGSLSVTDWEKLPSFGEADLERVNVIHHDGVDDYSHAAISNFRSGDSSGTISGWFKEETGAAGATFIFISSDTASGSHHLELFSYQGVTEFLYVSTVTHKVTTPDSAPRDKWNHVAVVSTGSAWSIWINGVSQPLTVTTSNSGNWFADMSTQRDNVAIGAKVRSTINNYALGNIANVAIRTGQLTAAQIIAECEQGYVDTAVGGVVNYWKLDEGTGTTPQDSVGTLHLTKAGGTWQKDTDAPADAIPTQLSYDVSGLSLTTIHTRLENTNQILGGEVLTEQSVDYVSPGTTRMMLTGVQAGA